MLLKKDAVSSTRYFNYYDVDYIKFITIECEADGSIKSIQLKGETSRDSSLFKATGLVYMENVCCGENNEYLDTDLLAAAEYCFTELKHEA